MHSSKGDLPVADSGGGYEGRFTDWGDFTVAFETIPAGSDFAPLLIGLPDDACQCPHWGFCFEGKFTLRYSDGSEESVGAGEAYYMAPGHVPVYLEDTMTLEFSPAADLAATMEVVGRNMAAAES